MTSPDLGSAKRAIENAPWGDTPLEYRAALKALHEAWGESGKPWPEFIAPLARQLGGEAQRAGEPTLSSGDEVERAARAIFAATGGDPADWDVTAKDYRCLDLARVALDAACKDPARKPS